MAKIHEFVLVQTIIHYENKGVIECYTCTYISPTQLLINISNFVLILQDQFDACPSLSSPVRSNISLNVCNYVRSWMTQQDAFFIYFINS